MSTNLLFIALAIIILIYILKKVTSLIVKIILAAFVIFYIIPHIGLALERIGYQLVNSNTYVDFGNILVKLGDFLIF